MFTSLVARAFLIFRRSGPLGSPSPMKMLTFACSSGHCARAAYMLASDKADCYNGGDSTISHFLHFPNLTHPLPSRRRPYLHNCLRLLRAHALTAQQRLEPLVDDR